MIQRPKPPFLGVDQGPGGKRHVNTEDDKDNDFLEEKDEAKRVYSAVGRTKYIFGSIPSPAVLDLRAGVPVIATMRVSVDVPVGSMGVVVGFRAPGKQKDDPMFLSGKNHWTYDETQIQKDWPDVDADGCWVNVDFTVDGVHHAVTVHPQKFVVDDQGDNEICSRVQVPLISYSYSFT